MIPDHLIDRAWRAYTWANNTQAIRNELAHPDLRGPMPPPPDPRLSMRTALEVVAADIWDEGSAAFEIAYKCDHADPWPHLRNNPYRASERRA